jgi:hypothetical protein
MEPKHYLAISLGVLVLYVVLYVVFPKFRKTSPYGFRDLVARVLGAVAFLLVAIILIEGVWG